jgi:N-hydroxyarylamine O-acetyltransferase
VNRYLERIGVDRPNHPDLDGLRRLQLAHLRTVPFENLSIHLDEPIVLTEAALFAKIVDRRRGGFCYELNGLFAALLTALGYEVDLLAARVFGSGTFGPPFDHLALRVNLGDPWLVDVGFGRFADAPLRLNTTAGQPAAGGVFHIETADDIIVDQDGEHQYRLDPRPYALTDFAPTCWWQQTSPDSHFTRALTCSLPTESGRVTLSGSRLITTTDGERVEQTLESADAVLVAYRTHFGIMLDRVPVLPT